MRAKHYLALVLVVGRLLESDWASGASGPQTMETRAGEQRRISVSSRRTDEKRALGVRGRAYTHEMPATEEMQSILRGDILGRLRDIYPCLILHIEGLSFRTDAYEFNYRGYLARFSFYMIKARVDTENGCDWLHLEAIREPFGGGGCDVMALSNGLDEKTPLPEKFVRNKIKPCPTRATLSNCK